MSRAYLGIGGNMGDRQANIDMTLELLRENDRIKLMAVSSVYETEPVGYTEQPWFLNIVAALDTDMNPYELLEYCGFIEQELRRERTLRWGPRTIDVDILLYDNIRLEEERLTIPHPRMLERGFVMIPLLELDSKLVINGRKIEDIVKNLETEEVRRVK